MQLPAAVVAIFLVGSGDDPSAAQAAMRAALSLENTVVFATGEPPPAEAAGFGARVGASLVAVVSFDPARGSARLRVQPAPQAEWIERELAFDSADAEVERARAVGFAILSMLPSSEPPAPPPPPPDRGPSGDRARRFPWVLEAGALATVGVGGAATALGGVAGGRVFVRGPAFLHAGLSARRGEVSSAQASTTFVTAAAGAGLSTRVAPGWVVGGRTDLVLQHLQISRVSPNADESGGRWVPGVQVLGEGGLRLSDHALVRAALGAEIAFGRTAVVVGGTRTGVVPPLRTLLELGVAVEF